MKWLTWVKGWLKTPSCLAYAFTEVYMYKMISKEELSPERYKSQVGHRDGSPPPIREIQYTSFLQEIERIFVIKALVVCVFYTQTVHLIHRTVLLLQLHDHFKHNDWLKTSCLQYLADM